MAAPKKVSVTYAFGRRDRVEPKLAPFGVLKTGRNLRIRKDGRLGARDGYQALDMGTAGNDLVAHDLHEYRGRLLALGSTTGAGYPTVLFEFVNQETTGISWLGNDHLFTRVTLNPFRNLREVAGVPQLDDGVALCDAAAGGGYVCLVYANGLIGIDRTFAIIVDAATDQTIHQEELTEFSAQGTVGRLRVIYTAGTFYVAAGFGSANPAVRIRQFTVGVDTAFSSFATVSGGGAAPTTALDICGVTNPGTARLVVALDTGATGDLRLFVFNGAGTQLGSTIAVAGINTRHVSIEADQTDNTINVFTVETATDGRLRTFNFAGTLLDGPTTTTSGATGFICRLPAQVGFAEHVAVAVNDANSAAVVEFRDIDTHALTASTTVNRAVCASRLLSGQSPGQSMAVVFSALVGADLTTFEGATNALFFVTDDVAHMSSRDVLTGERRGPVNLSRDTNTGEVCWVALRDPGVNIAMPVVTLLDFQSSDRVQSAQFGGLLYFAGATPTVYDGRFPVGLNFNERPAIISATPSNGLGSLAPSAAYKYVVHWEYTLADGSVIVGPVSAPFDATTGAGQDTMTVVVTTPHTVSVALGDTLLGATVSAALFRTGWNSVASIPGSVFNRCATQPVAVGMANYGALLSITDTTSDADIADEEIVYTQDGRGPISAPLQHEAPLSCEHIAATEARLLTGGLTQASLMQISKGAYLDEALEFNQLDVYFAKLTDDVRGVASLDSVKLAFTSDAVFALGGDGPDDIGVGTLSAPVEIPAPGGLKTPWSFLKAPDGLWFQLDDSKLFRMPRGGGAPTWEGIDVHDTLIEYPVITGACKHRGDSAGIFACSNVSGTDARFLVRDFRTEQWFEDEPLLGTDGAGIEAITSFGDGIAYLSFGLVFHQVVGSFTDGAGTFISTYARTHPLYPFGVGGYGQIYELLLTGEYRDACLLECRVSYDDGLTFTGLESFNLEDLTPGQTIQRKWTLPQDITSSVVIEFATSEALGGRGPTEGFVFNQVDLLVGPEDGLRELTPDEMA
jgi:hypothetical protein